MTLRLRNKILWSDEHHMWRKPGTSCHLCNTLPTVKQWGCFSEAGTGKLVKVEGKLKTAKYRDILNENLKTLDWSKGSPPNWTLTLSTQPRQRKSGIGTTPNVLE